MILSKCEDPPYSERALDSFRSIRGIQWLMLITRKAEFSASHRCYNPNLSEEQNRDLYGERASSHGHGHNYILEVTMEGEPDPVTGMVVDLKVRQRHHQ